MIERDANGNEKTNHFSQILKSDVQKDLANFYSRPICARVGISYLRVQVSFDLFTRILITMQFHDFQFSPTTILKLQFYRKKEKKNA